MPAYRKTNMKLNPSNTQKVTKTEKVFSAPSEGITSALLGQVVRVILVLHHKSPAVLHELRFNATILDGDSTACSSRSIEPHLNRSSGASPPKNRFVAEISFHFDKLAEEDWVHRCKKNKSRFHCSVVSRLGRIVHVVYSLRAWRRKKTPLVNKLTTKSVYKTHICCTDAADCVHSLY